MRTTITTLTRHSTAEIVNSISTLVSPPDGTRSFSFRLPFPHPASSPASLSNAFVLLSSSLFGALGFLYPRFALLPCAASPFRNVIHAHAIADLKFAIGDSNPVGRGRGNTSLHRDDGRSQAPTRDRHAMAAARAQPIASGALSFMISARSRSARSMPSVEEVSSDRDDRVRSA